MSLNKIIQKYFLSHKLRCDFEIELLVYGYLKKCTDQCIPEDINKLCIVMYGNDLFYWVIKTSKLKSLRDITSFYRIAAIPQGRSSKEIKSDIFSFQRVQFQLHIKAIHGDNVEILLHLISKHVYVSGTARIVVEKPYYESEQYFQFRYASDNIRLSDQYDRTSPTFTPTNCTDERLTFICSINIFKIELMNSISTNNDARLIKSYHKKTKLKKNITYKWLLKHSTPIIEKREKNMYISFSNGGNEDSPQIFYYSPSFDKGNWRLLYIERDNRCQVCLHLISKISKNISVKWRVSVHYENISNSWECVAQFRPGVKISKNISREISPRPALIYENQNVWIKEYDTESLCIISNIEILKPADYTMSKRISVLESDIKEMKNVMKQMINKQEELISMVNKRSSKNNSATMVVMDEKSKIQQWLSLIELPQYFDAFISNGYESLNFIKKISNKTELFEIGVELKGHQTQLLAEIKKIQSLQHS